ncbi:MAG TPA: MFS transporter [Candidatus Limnocylindria bacterium]|nr:MFS transporter [Candidatus Limnocylindria bacterium]
MARVLPDTSPLRASREYRLLWSGQLVSQAGSALRLVAVPYQIYLLTGSSLAVGLIGLFSAGPLIAFSLFGGVIADRVDRRRLLLVTQTCLALVSAALALATALGVVSVPLLYALTAIGAGFGALDQPARSALAPSLLERRLIPAAMALNQMGWRTGSIVGPALGGVVIASFGLAWAYWIDVATFVVAIVALAIMRIPAFVPSPERPHVLRSLREGLAFLVARPLLFATMGVDFCATLFGTTRALMPYFADRVFHVGPEGLGLLYAAPGIGATAVVLTSGWTAGIQRKGLAVLVAIGIFGLANAAFAFVPSGAFLAACALLAIAEGADSVSVVFRHTILQMETPDALRGRLSSINTIFVAGGPQLGQVESGFVADALSPELAIAAGGLVCVGAVLAAATAVPQIARYRADVVATST